MDIARLSADAARWYIAQIDNILKLFFMYFSFLHWDYVLSVCGSILFSAIKPSSARIRLYLAKEIYKSCVHMYTTSKRIKLESPGCSGFEVNL
jgi:hypothetical protein